MKQGGDMEHLRNVHRERFQCLSIVNITVTEQMKTTWISLIAVNCIAALPTIVLNLLVIWTVLENKNTRSRIYNLVLAILAFTDLVIGLLGHPLTVVRHLACLTQNCKLPCGLSNIISTAVMTCYFLTLCTIAVATFERYLAIEHPFFYREEKGGCLDCSCLGSHFGHFANK